MPVVAVLPLPPTAGSVVLGIAAVLVGALVAAAAGHQARHSGNWLYHVGTVAGLLLVAGVAGQRTVADGAPIGPWDAGIALPLIGVRLTPVAAAGLILAVVCATLVLLFEHAPSAARGDAGRVHRPLEDDDAV